MSRIVFLISDTIHGGHVDSYNLRVGILGWSISWGLNYWHYVRHYVTSLATSYTHCILVTQTCLAANRSLGYRSVRVAQNSEEGLYVADSGN